MFSSIWLAFLAIVHWIKNIQAATWMNYLILEKIKENYTFINHKMFFF